MKYRHIVFDIDGTLLNNEYANLKSLQDTLLEVEGVRAELDSLRFILGIPGKEALDILKVRDAKKVYDVWNKNFVKHYDDITLFPGIGEVLLKLKEEGFSLGIITSKTRQQYDEGFVPHGFLGYFGTVICAEDTLMHKPDPEPMQRYLEKAGARREEVLYIGDSIYDMQCARSAGVSSALALWGCTSPEGISAEHYVETPLDLIALLEMA